MKTTNLLKSLILAALLAVGANMSAQVIATLPTYDIEVDSSSLPDTVSVGAVMPYYVHPDAAIKNSPLFNPSGFDWTISGSAATLNTGAWTASPVAAGYVVDTMVIATFPNTGDVTISTTERSNPKFNATAGCDGNQRDLGVNVIDLPVAPTIADEDTAQGGCSAAATYDVAFDFSGSTVKFPVYVEYTIQYFDINDDASGTPVSLIYQINNSDQLLQVTQAQLNDAADVLVTDPTPSGRYAVILGNIWDRISIRSTNAPALAVDADIHASIVLFPTPVTQPIKHISTL